MKNQERLVTKNAYQVVGVIPARYQSSRFPGKPLAKIHGRSMIQHVYERCLRAKKLDLLIVATDDKRIEKEVIGFNGQVLLTSPNHKTGTDRVVEVAKSIKTKIVVNIQGDEPLIDPKVIDQTVKASLKNNIPVCTPVVEINKQREARDPHTVKAVLDKNHFILYFSRALIPFHREMINTGWYKHIGLYVYKKNILLRFAKLKKTSLEIKENLEQLRFLENNIKIKAVITKYNSLGVDIPQDIKKVESLIYA